MNYAEEEFISVLFSVFKIMRPAQQLVRKAFDERTEFHASGKFMWFPTSCPWKSHLYTIEEETKNEGAILFVFF